MTSTAGSKDLKRWFHSNGGRLHENVEIVHNQTSGVHLRAIAPCSPGTTIVCVPHALSLSYLNALVDDALPVFREQRDKFKVEAIGFFYLMIQYVSRRTSFWKSYFDTLPSPDELLSQPLFSREAEDVIWLQGTDVWHTVSARKEIYGKYYNDGISILEEAGVDVEPLTWQLFLWSITMFTSRSFISKSLHPDESGPWTTYRTAINGLREAVKLDMSDVDPEDLVFPVLFPGLDVANHSHEAKAEWTFERQAFNFTINEHVDPGVEIYNNYGPKGNDELLVGYGFCIPNNPYDTVAMTLKPPYQDLQDALKSFRPEYFDRAGEWSTQRTTYRLKHPPSMLHRPNDVFEHLPGPLLELLTLTLRHERGLPLHNPITSSDYERWQLHIARMIVQSLHSKLTSLFSTSLPPPRTKSQHHASIYRHSQIRILESLIASLRAYTRSLIWSPSLETTALPSSPCLARLEHLLPYLQNHSFLDEAFLSGIEANANVRDLTQLRLAGWEEDVWVLLLCYLALLPSMPYTLRSALPDLSSSTLTLEAEEVAQANELLDIVHTSAEACPNSTWADERWSAEFIARVGGRAMRWESFVVGCDDGDGGEDARLCLYLCADT